MATPRQPTQAAGKSLFSLHYLETRLPDLSEWQEEAAPLCAALQTLWRKAQQLGANWNEAQTEDEFVKPVLELLGWSYIPQVKNRSRGRVNRPDYALFADEATKEAAYPHQGDDDAFYGRALAIAEAKYWGRPLSQKDASGRDAWKSDNNPSHQMVSYLMGARCTWGILTNGKQWRLYSREVSSTASEYYEVDLEEVFGGVGDGEIGEIKAFKRWWLFFRRAAFTPDSGGRSFVQRVHEGSATYAREVSDKLKELVFREVMPEIAGGFVAYRRRELSVERESEESLRQLYGASLSLLYKLLFVLYAEARSLLPVTNPAYWEESLTRMAQEFAARIDRELPYSDATHATRQYDALLALFRRIDQGDASLGVPRYDGGLFNAASLDNQFLAQHKLSDRAVAHAVDILVRDAGQPVDYAYISVRNLGSIYEGLLENKLRVVDAAAGQVELVNDKGERKATGSYYTPDYIVDYIVEGTLAPILAGRQERFVAAMARVADLRRQLQHADGPGRVALLRPQLDRAEREARESFLGIKVCDPAMGSGHFLVNAVDYITDSVIEQMQRYHDEHPTVPWAWNPIQTLIDRVRQDILAEMERQGIAVEERREGARLDDTALLTRLVMKRCIYGVDLNPMAVELAKLSLWLHSFTVGAPLSFLDHHLRWGNSLIGSDVRTVEETLVTTRQTRSISQAARQLARARGERARDQAVTYQANLFGGPFAGLLDLTAIMIEIAGQADSTLADVRQSAEHYRTFQANLLPYKQTLDLWVSQHFGNAAALDFLETYPTDVLPALRGERKLSKAHGAAIDQARTLWQEKRFFHWDLEFPEVFIDLERRDWAENPGFDAVIGNPPYDVLAEKEREEDLKGLIRFLESDQDLQPALGRKLDLFRLFVAKAIGLCEIAGFVGLIVPMSLLADQQTAQLRKFLLRRTKIAVIEAFPQKDDPSRRIFPEAKLPTCVLVTRNLASESEHLFTVTVHPGKLLDEVVGHFSCKLADIEALDSDHLPIPLLTSDTAISVLRKISSHTITVKMGNLCVTYQGEINETTMAAILSSDPSTGPRVLRGGNVQRYELLPEPRQGVPKYLDLHRYEQVVGGERSKHTKLERIGYQRNAALDSWRRLLFGPLPRPSFCFDSVSYYVVADRQQAMMLMSLLNSQLLEWRFRLTSTNNHVSTSEIAALPIYRFDFTTPPDDRTHYAEKGRRLYERFCAKEDYACVLGFVEHHLAQGQSDVVHDLLAFLAEQMIELNRAKQTEIKGFLAWLQREIGATIDTLTNKSALQNYPGDYQKGEPHLTLEGLLDVLRKNRRKLAVDPGRRAFQEQLQAEYEASLGKLLPLKQRLSATDRLIDRVVYRLYGLADEEIAVVEGIGESRHS
jgi:hypothetical protein